jgi:hypothetical protein
MEARLLSRFTDPILNPCHRNGRILRKLIVKLRSGRSHDGMMGPSCARQAAKERRWGLPATAQRLVRHNFSDLSAVALAKAEGGRWNDEKEQPVRQLVRRSHSEGSSLGRAKGDLVSPQDAATQAKEILLCKGVERGHLGIVAPVTVITNNG